MAKEKLYYVENGRVYEKNTGRDVTAEFGGIPGTFYRGGKGEFSAGGKDLGDKV